MTQPTHREPIRFLVFSASLRHDSLNTRLASLAAACIRAHGGEVDLASMADFDCPSYNQDIRDSQGFPEGAVELKRRLEASDAFVISSPEYNASMPGFLKNSIDWVSRVSAQPFNERHALLLAVDGRRQSRPVGAPHAPRASRSSRLSRHVLAGAGAHGL